MIPPLWVLLADVEANARRVVVPMAVNELWNCCQSPFGGGPFVDVEWATLLESRDVLVPTSVTAMLAVLTPPSEGLSA